MIWLVTHTLIFLTLVARGSANIGQGPLCKEMVFDEWRVADKRTQVKKSPAFVKLLRSQSINTSSEESVYDFHEDNEGNMFRVRTFKKRLDNAEKIQRLFTLGHENIIFPILTECYHDDNFYYINEQTHGRSLLYNISTLDCHLLNSTTLIDSSLTCL